MMTTTKHTLTPPPPVVEGGEGLGSLNLLQMHRIDMTSIFRWTAEACEKVQVDVGPYDNSYRPPVGMLGRVTGLGRDYYPEDGRGARLPGGHFLHWMSYDEVTGEALTRSTYFPATVGELLVPIVYPSTTSLFELWMNFPNCNLSTYGKINRFSTGSDPEVLVRAGDGKPLPAYTFLSAKGEETGVPFWDGVQAEFTTLAYSCHAYFTDALQVGLKRVLSAARKVDPGATLDPRTVVTLTPDQLESAKREHIQFGCSPSLNAYDLTAPMLDDGTHTLVRFAGCHHHISLPAAWKSEEKCREIVKVVDSVCGVALTTLFAGLEDPIRRQYYGLAGEFRRPKHGLEWRVPSSAVLLHPAIVHLSFDLFRAVVGMVTAEHPALAYWKASEDEVIEVINNYNISLGQEILLRNVQLLRLIVAYCYPFFPPGTYTSTLSDAQLWTCSTIINGIAPHISTNMAENWLFHDVWAGHSESRDCQWGKFATARATSDNVREIRKVLGF